MRKEDPVICVCMQVRKSEIIEVIKNEGCSTLSEIQKFTDVGLGCGSCIEEIEEILEEVMQQK